MFKLLSILVPSTILVLRTILVLGTILVPNIILASNGTSTKLELVPKVVPMVPNVPKGPVARKDALAGHPYLTLECGLPKNMQEKLRRVHHMEPVWWGESHHKHMFFLHHNTKNSNWGLFVAFSSGEFCTVSTGTGEALVIRKKGVIH